MPCSRRRGMLVGMAKPLAKLVKLLAPKWRWGQFSLATMFVVVTALSGVSSSSVRLVTRVTRLCAAGQPWIG